MVKSEIKRVEHGGKIKELREKTGKIFLDFSVNLNPIPPVLNMNSGILGIYQRVPVHFDDIIKKPEG